MNFYIHQKPTVATIPRSTASTSGYRIVFKKINAEEKINIHQQAIQLAKHIDIIKESRDIIKRGETMTLDEFMAEDALDA